MAADARAITGSLLSSITLTWQEGAYRRVLAPLHNPLAIMSPTGVDSTPITCVAIAADQRRLLSGDARGRVHAWCLPDAAGKDHWMKDSHAAACMGPVGIHIQ